MSKKTSKIYLIAGCIRCCIASVLFLFCALIAYEQEKNILLVINYNHPHYVSVDLLEEIYKPYFENIVFYGPAQHNKVKLCQHHCGWLSYMALAYAIKERPNFSGYLYIHDDLIIHPWHLNRFDKKKLWVVPYLTCDMSLGAPTVANWCWWEMHCGYQAYKKVYEKLDEQSLAMHENNLGPLTGSLWLLE